MYVIQCTMYNVYGVQCTPYIVHTIHELLVNVCRTVKFILKMNINYVIEYYVIEYHVNKGVIVSISNTASIITLELPKSDNNNNNNNNNIDNYLVIYLLLILKNV